MKELLGDIAYQNSLEHIETTSERNGYPSNLKKAIIGFETFEEAKKLADENGLSIEIFEKRDGWQLYYRTGNKAYEALKISSDSYGDNYRSFQSNEIEDFFKHEVKAQLPFFNSFDDIESFLSKKKEIYEALETADDDELVITCDGVYYDIVKKHTMSFSEDTKTTVIGLIEK